MEERHERNAVILRFRDGHIEHAILGMVDVDHEVVRLREANGDIRDVAFAELKAVFFPRDVPEELLPPQEGSTIAIEFADTEVIRGFAHYNPAVSGFFLYPVDRTKNDRIFIISSAVLSIEVEKM